MTIYENSLNFFVFFLGGGPMEFIAGIYILQFITNAYPPNWLV